MFKSPVKIGIVIDPIHNIKTEKDTSLAIMRAAQRAGATLFVMEQDDMFIHDNASYAYMQAITVKDDNTDWYDISEKERMPMAHLDIVFMRKDPPVNKRFIHTTYVLEQAEKDGVCVTNPANTLRKFNEKIFATEFPEFSPAYTIGTTFDMFETFLNTHKKIIMKPLDGMGGEGVFFVEQGDVNFDVIWENLTQNGTYPIIAQSFISDISAGDKRVLIIDGVPFPHMLVRLPKEGSIRGNLAVNGAYDVRPLSRKDMAIATTVGARLKQENIMLAGIDIIGTFLTEVNITSPTGFCEIARATGNDPADVLIARMLNRATEKMRVI